MQRSGIRSGIATVPHYDDCFTDRLHKKLLKELKDLLQPSSWSEVGKVRDGDRALKRQLFNIRHSNASF